MISAIQNLFFSDQSEVSAQPNFDSIEYFRQISHALDELNYHLSHKNLHILAPDEFREVRSAVDECYKRAQKIWKTAPPSEEISALKAKAFTAKLGGKLAPETFAQPGFMQFITANHFHHGCQAVGLQITGIPLVLENGDVIEIPWNELNIEVDPETEMKTFFLRDRRVAFKTDKDFMLLDDYTLNYQGINHYNAFTSSHLLPLDVRDPAEWNNKCLLEVWTAVTQDPNDVGGCTGQHAFFVLKTSQGEIFSHGKYPRYDQVSNLDYIFFTGRKRGGFMAPDWYSFLPTDAMNADHTTFELSEEVFQYVFNECINDRNEENIPFSLFHNNCISYVKCFLKSRLGLSLNSDIMISSYLFGKLPSIIQTPIKALKTWLYDSLPESLQFMINVAFFPTYYLFNVFVGLMAKTLSIWNHARIEGCDLSFVNIFTLNTGVDHPLVLRESLNALESDTPIRIDTIGG
ncbi:MAG: hypothetical protein KAR79_01255 [Simkaniaceae bacterium]|nr:hypothetical protein [Simkaniaceae bacterium]